MAGQYVRGEALGNGQTRRRVRCQQAREVTVTNTEIIPRDEGVYAAYRHAVIGYIAPRLRARRRADAQLSKGTYISSFGHD
jgi:hypothetical protein